MNIAWRIVNNYLNKWVIFKRQLKIEWHNKMQIID